MEVVSVIMPCYNDGKYIEQAVASLRAQTYQQNELIVVDDGSDDPHTIQTLHDLSFPRLKKIHMQHMGPAYARNKGIAAAQGSYILPLDADDRIEPTYVEKAVRILDASRETGIVYCQADFFGEKSGKWELPPYSLKEMLAGNVIFASAMFRKADWEKAGGYNTAMKHGLEDYDFWLSLLGNGAQVYQIQEVLFHYRIKPVSRSSVMQKSLERMQEAYCQVYINHKAFFDSHHELYAEALREKAVRQAFEIERMHDTLRLYEDRHVFLTLIKKMPGVRFIARLVLHGRGSREKG